MAYPKKKTGKSLEKLIEHLEKVLTDNTNTTIQAPVRLTDRITGRKREHDVLIGYVSYRSRTLLCVKKVSEMAKEVLILKRKKAK